MPTVAQCEIPPPKSWDEFEDIVADLYRRIWDDPGATRCGRGGQSQNGVDIYGLPERLSGEYAGIQCKRYRRGTLTRTIVEREIAEAEKFVPALAEFIIATTDRRDAELQQAVREIDKERQRASKFPVRIVFWEDLCGQLANLENRDLLHKHYSDLANLPLPYHDSISLIEEQFVGYTRIALDQIRLSIPGLSQPLDRNEIQRCQDRLHEGRAVALTGRAGTGKSGIAKSLAISAAARGTVVLLLDARRVAPVNNSTQLRQHFDLKDPVPIAVRRVGQSKGVRLIIDQLDNIAGSAAGTLLVELAIRCNRLEQAQVIVVSRRQETQESDMLKRLFSSGFEEVVSQPLSEDKALKTLQLMGILDAPDDLVGLARNLLNLEIIGTIKRETPAFDFGCVMDEVDLWDQYRKNLLEKEGEEVVAAAVDLAKRSLMHPDGQVALGFPCSRPHRRLLSSRVVVRIDGRVVRFLHEKMQDYLYAWDATERGAMSRDVIREIGPYRARNVLVWMERIYSWKGSPFRTRFLEGVLNVKI